MNNDATTTRSETDRIDWANIGHVIKAHGDEGLLYLPDFKTISEYRLTHVAYDHRRRVNRQFVITYSEAPVEPANPVSP